MYLAILIVTTAFSSLTAHATDLCSANMSRSSIPTLQWPSDGQPVELDILVKTIRDDLNVFELKRKPDVLAGSINWPGQRRITGIYVTENDLVQRFGEDSLKDHAKESRDELNVVIRTYLNLGMEQGRRDFLESPAYQEMLSKVLRLKEITESPQSDFKLTIDSLIQIKKSFFEILINAEREIIQSSDKDLGSYREIVKMIDGYYFLTDLESKQLRQTLVSLSRYGRQQGVRMWYLKSRRSLLAAMSSLNSCLKILNSDSEQAKAIFDQMARMAAEELVITAANLSSN